MKRIDNFNMLDTEKQIDFMIKLFVHDGICDGCPIFDYCQSKYACDEAIKNYMNGEFETMPELKMGDLIETDKGEELIFLRSGLVYRYYEQWQMCVVPLTNDVIISKIKRLDDKNVLQTIWEGGF